MTEYNSGMDPEIKRYFRRIIRSFSWGLLWLMGAATAGLFFRLGIIRNGWQWYNILFYIIAVVSLFFLLRYLYRSWNQPFHDSDIKG